MNKLILDAIKTSIERYPDIIKYLDGNARLWAAVYEYKIGEAPDDEVRDMDEKKLERRFASFLRGQLARVIEEVNNTFYKSIFQMSFWDNEKRKMWDELSGVFIDIVLHGVDGAVSLLPDEGKDIINISAIQNRVIERAMGYRQEWVNTINETTMRNVWDRINTWRQSGDPIENLIEMLEDDPFLFSKTRARMFAITETTRLNAVGHQMTYEESGYINQFKWQTANDELVCAICGPNNGKLFPVSELSSLIPAHPNCRCWDTPIVDVDAFGETLDFTPERGEWY